MNALVIYDSLYGNTEKIAEAIACVLRQYGHARVVPASTVTVLDFLGINVLALGGPTQKHGLSPAIEDLLDRMVPEKLVGMPAVAYDTRVHITGWLSGSAAEKIARRIQRYGVKLVLPPESFFVEGREGPLEKGEVERAGTWARTILEHIGTTPLEVA
jgi:flavodoxin